MSALDLDIVICVHNALKDVRACLESVAIALSGGGKIILVDDASDLPTSQFLAEFAPGNAAILLRHDQRQGYTKAANAGVRLSTAGTVLLLNSDTIMPAGALDKLTAALNSIPSLGIVGPLSNAASWQSVPSTEGTASQTAINALPPGMSVTDMDRFFEDRMGDAVAKVPLVHGFCFCVKRAVFDAIGLFDEVNFPRGYGEENDFCFRAADAGFHLGIALNTYVFHSKSKSYEDVERIHLMSGAMTALIGKVSESRVLAAVELMRANPDLAAARAAALPFFNIASAR